MVALKIAIGDHWEGEFEINLAERIPLDNDSTDNHIHDGRHWFMSLIRLYNSSAGNLDKPWPTLLECYPGLGGQYGQTLKFLIGTELYEKLETLAETRSLGSAEREYEVKMDDMAYGRMMQLIRSDIKLNC